MATNKKFPQVIFFGNGINRAFGGMSWGEILHEMTADSKKHVDVNQLKSPMPLQAIYLTDDNVNNTLKEHKYKLFGKIGEDKHLEILRQILSINADHIITTNYSYELEFAAYPQLLKLSDKAKERKIEQLRVCGNDKKQGNKYMLYEFNRLLTDSSENKIWHIHGEARKHSSIVLGHYYYGMLLNEIIAYSKSNRNNYQEKQKNGEEIKIKSWIDAFIMGDVYVLGSRFDLSEMDLWWLIARKKRENADCGKIYFYEPKEISENIDERLEILNIYADIKDMGVQIPKRDDTNPQVCEERDKGFKDFYIKAVEDIAAKIKQKQVTD